MSQTIAPLPVTEIRSLCEKHGITELAVFGSFLRNDFRPDSDVDILISLAPGVVMTPEKYVDLRDELSVIFDGREIDLVQKRLLTNPFRRHAILATHRVLYAA